jgi:hypothetical protein
VRFRPEEGSTKLPQTGGCQCGQIRYEITQEPQLVYSCHSLDCQRLTSSAFSLGVVVPEMGFRLTGVEPRQLQRSGIRLLGVRNAEGWCSPRQGWHAGGYVLAAAREAHMGSQDRRRGSSFPRAVNSSKDSLRDRTGSLLASLRSPTER